MNQVSRDCISSSTLFASLEGGGRALKLGFPVQRALRLSRSPTEAVASSAGRSGHAGRPPRSAGDIRPGHARVQTELGSSRLCQTPEGRRVVPRRKGVGRNVRSGQGAGRESGKHRSLARPPLHHRPSMAFIWCKDSPCSKELPPPFTSTLCPEKQLPRASVTLEAAWPRPAAWSLSLDPDTLAGRGGVAWHQQRRDWPRSLP